MQYNVIGYNNELKGQVEASNITEAWEAARLMYLDILDVTLVSLEREPIQVGYFKPEGFEWYFSSFSSERIPTMFDFAAENNNEVILYHVKDGEYSIYVR